MCLMTITKRIDKPTNDERFAYKVFIGYPASDNLYGEFKTSDNLYGEFKTPSGIDRQKANININQTRPYERDKWIKANTEANIGTGTGIDKYRAGFHCFATKSAATVWASTNALLEVVRVKIRKIRTIGTQAWGKGRLKTFVADEMFIPE